MSDMVERAAKALAEWNECDEPLEGHRVAARRALLAALDPEDEALVDVVAKAIFTAAHTRGWVGDNVIALPWDPQTEEIKREYRDFGRAALVSLKAASQGEQRDG